VASRLVRRTTRNYEVNRSWARLKLIVPVFLGKSSIARRRSITLIVLNIFWTSEHGVGELTRMNH
jgi:hypothetical protein